QAKQTRLKQTATGEKEIVSSPLPLPLLPKENRGDAGERHLANPSDFVTGFLFVGIRIILLHGSVPFLQTRSIRVANISDLAEEREIREFFSFSGDIEHIEIRGSVLSFVLRFLSVSLLFRGLVWRYYDVLRGLFQCSGAIFGSNVVSGRIAFVTFKDPKALEIALLLSVSSWVRCSSVPKEIFHEEHFAVICLLVFLVVSLLVLNSMQQVMADDVTIEAPVGICSPTVEVNDLFVPMQGKSSPGGGQVHVSKAQDVVAAMIAKGSAFRQDAISKAKAFDEKHQLTAKASAKVSSFDKRVGFSEKITVGISVVNEKVKSVDEKLHVSNKTMAAFTVAEQKLNDTGTAVKTNRCFNYFNRSFMLLPKNKMEMMTLLICQITSGYL
ncbi:hypothetical protein BHE74_00025658, partial [Ensete ventricosum]